MTEYQIDNLGQAAEAIRQVTADGQRLELCGAGTKRHLGRIASYDHLLDAGGMSGIIDYQPEELVLTLRAGTPMNVVEDALAGARQMLAFEPPSMTRILGEAQAGVRGTIGGLIATNISGPRRLTAGAARDYLLGFEAVSGRGEHFKSGGKVMKNVTGYDLVKLMSGSFGTLGVLTELSFKVMPKPQTQADLLIEGLTEETAVAAMSAALGSPFDVSGAAHLALGQNGAPVTMIRVEGFEASVAYRADRLRDLLAKFGAFQIETDPQRTAARWTAVRDVEVFHGRQGDVWRISCKPSDGPQLADRLGADGILYDWGGGLIWALVPDGTDVRARLGAFGGHASVIRASAETKARLGVFQPEPAGVAALSAGLKAKFDPRGILNPGLMG